MLCAISGEAPQNPVASSKSGNVFEKRLIEAYISENHKDPVNGEDLEVSDLIDLKTARIVTPRPPTLTSIPSLLSTFQNEWDALALDAFTIRQQLQQTRQELATALYQNDAAVRVIVRLTKERDAARDALSKVSLAGGAGAAAEEMELDNRGLGSELSAELADQVDATQEKLSKSRRKRPIPDGWVGAETVGKFGVMSTSEQLCRGTTFLALDESGAQAIVGGVDGVACIYSIADNRSQKEYKLVGEVTDAVWFHDSPVISTSTGVVKVFHQDVVTFTSHVGRVNALALHPSLKILASVGADKSFVFYDMPNMAVTQVYTESELTCAAFHPDGHLFAAGDDSGQIKLFHVKNGENAANFDLGGSVKDIAFSENGIWFAAVAKGSSNIVVFDVRKEGKAAEAKVLKIRGQVDSIRWDYTGQFLAASGPGGLTISQYTKSNKSWSELISAAVPATGLAWGNEAKTLVTVNGDGIVTVLG